MLGGLRSSFLTGLVVIAPVGMTVWLIWTVIGWVDGFVLPFVPDPYKPDRLFQTLFGWEETQADVRGIGVVVFFLFTIFVGWTAKGLIGRSFIRWAESVVDRMPVVRSLYNGLKQIAETVFSQSSEAKFDKAVLLQYPRIGIWSIGFVSTTAKGEVRQKVPRDDKMTSVFLPTTPNPTSGFLLFVPDCDLIYLDMTIEDAAKLVISAGLVYPNELKPARGGQIPPVVAAPLVVPKEQSPAAAPKVEIDA
ncbi:MAG: putative membrane protein [Paracoccaceae bacterium]|jgi:uncharacterized membrane protein